MDISVKITKENKDGSADAVVRFDKLGLEVLVQWGLIAMLKEGINEYATSKQIEERANAAAGKTFKTKKTAVKKTPSIKKPLAKKAKK
jgi:hypothetical protein